MGRGVEGQPGGILHLVSLAEEYEDALEFDLLERGKDIRDLGTPRLTWRHFKVYVLGLAQDPKSLFARAYNPDVIWTLEALLQAEVIDTLHDLRWMKTKDGSKNRNRPKPLKRPGVEVREDEEVVGDAMEMDDLKALIGWS